MSEWTGRREETARRYIRSVTCKIESHMRARKSDCWHAGCVYAVAFMRRSSVRPRETLHLLAFMFSTANFGIRAVTVADLPRVEAHVER